MHACFLMFNLNHDDFMKTGVSAKREKLFCGNNRFRKIGEVSYLYELSDAFD